MKTEEKKLPMYYEQINSIMKIMAKTYLHGKGFLYLNSLRQLYTRVRPDLEEGRKKYFDIMFGKLGKKLNLPLAVRPRINLALRGGYAIEKELFDDLDKIGIFKALKENVEEMI